MSTKIRRGPLTDAMLVALTAGLSTYGDGAGLPVGDGVVPKGGGWTGEPNAPTSVFRPYVVLLSGTANQSSGAIGDSQSDWQFPYLLASFSSSRKGLDWIADRCRNILGGLRHGVYSLGEDSYKVINVRVDSIGGTNRVDATDPPYWGQSDGLTMMMGVQL